MSELLNNYAKLTDAIAHAETNQNASQAVTLLAVSKTKPAAVISALAQLGHRDFAENYLQEAVEKKEELSSDAACKNIVWHFIGSIQRNKTRDIAQHFDWVHTVSRPIIAKRLSDQRSPEKQPLNVCIQVNIDEENTKSGCMPSDALALAQDISHYKNLCLRGLMVIPSKSGGDAFSRTKVLFDEIGAVLGSPDWDTLSMGMSADYEDAIKHGATMVRVGSALFGKREYS